VLVGLDLGEEGGRGGEGVEGEVVGQLREEQFAGFHDYLFLWCTGGDRGRDWVVRNDGG